MTAILTHGDFAPHVHKSFRFEGWDGVLRLDGIDLGRGPEGMRPPFSLIFQGPPGNVLPEGLHKARVEDGPELEFYIQPIQTLARDRQDYQAVFN